MNVDSAVRAEIEKIGKDRWDGLSKRRIYFGHQSVGFNIVNGIRDLQSVYPVIALHVVEAADLSGTSGPVFAHSVVGQNGDMQSKIAGFSKNLATGKKQGADIAFLKFCYVDVDEKTDVGSRFEDYRKSLSALRNANPGTTFVHLTVPLTYTRTGIRTYIKKALGKTELWEYESNVRRNRYNELVRSEYRGKEPLFDLAEAESTYPDGKRASFELAGKRYEQVVPEYTDDGGHLNEAGRRIVAARLLVFLSTLLPAAR